MVPKSSLELARHRGWFSLKRSSSARDIDQEREGADALPDDPTHRTSGVQARARRASPDGDAQRLQPALVSIRCAAGSGLLDATYSYLAAYCAASLRPTDAQRVNVATYELLANAMKHGLPGGDVILELRQTERGVELLIENDAEPPQLSRLSRQVDRVNRDAELAFGEEMGRFASGSAPVPMLGIVRVGHECGLALELRLDGSHVRLTAVCPA